MDATSILVYYPEHDSRLLLATNIIYYSVEIIAEAVILQTDGFPNYLQTTLGSRNRARPIPFLINTFAVLKDLSFIFIYFSHCNCHEHGLCTVHRTYNDFNTTCQLQKCCEFIYFLNKRRVEAFNIPCAGGALKLGYFFYLKLL